MKQYQFYTADVFTDEIFGGNQLAVFPQATGLNSQQMQKIAAEFNYSETVFVLPPETPQGTRKLRIFTPGTELPFAGHPTVGTAYVLTEIGEISAEQEDFSIIFEEGVGLIPVNIKTNNKRPIYTELTAAQLPEFQSDISPISDLALILGIDPQEITNNPYAPQAVSCGVPFLFIRVKNREILGKIAFNRDHWQRILSQRWASSIYVFCNDPERNGSHWRSRMFAPAMGILEDPATGSAATALGGYLGTRETLTEGTLHWRIEQGFEMGRPSILEIFVDKKQGKIRQIRVGGASVLVSKGTMTIPTF